MTDTITVTVRDRTVEPDWGSGILRVCTREVEISTSCARCGGRRGIPMRMASTTGSTPGAWGMVAFTQM
ncbi:MULTISPECIES: hypothetical protein [Rhodococcus]|uniref:hypothetical protein n=1 Tax=Rhodococcus TaxID=1827 RepID=UPI002952CCC7|nr:MULTISPECIES: hypothetical protein [Rhodococcus]MDV7246369.1 hypothetical protein [Rhodococcus oxybenzonivorans]MDV7337349.1 hypothetical protein [Rhodococcus oxybenzonivorans]MDV7348031.1 hypothetical protein [Rhodococcus oxybenzonivorans]MDV8031632.1 hypothetical protein [Rhodococcus sp. IEGM 27]